MLSILKRGRPEEDVFYKSLDAVTTVANDISKKIGELDEKIEKIGASVSGLRIRVDYLHSIVLQRNGDGFNDFIRTLDIEVRLKASRLKELQQTKKKLIEYGDKELVSRIENEIRELKKELREKILCSLIEYVIDRL